MPSSFSSRSGASLIRATRASPQRSSDSFPNPKSATTVAACVSTTSEVSLPGDWPRETLASSPNCFPSRLTAVRSPFDTADETNGPKTLSDKSRTRAPDRSLTAPVLRSKS